MLAIFKKRQFSSKEIFYQCKSPFAKTFLAFSHKILENSHIFKFFVVLAKRNANFYWFVAKSSHFGYFCIYSHQKNLVATPSSKQPHWLLIATFGNTDCLGRVPNRNILLCDIHSTSNLRLHLRTLLWCGLQIIKDKTKVPVFS